MRLVRNILSLLFIVAVIYGIIGVKSVAYCCGQCGKSAISHVETDGNCCNSGESTTKSSHDCKDLPCQVVFFEYDWDAVHLKYFDFSQITVVTSDLFLNNTLKSFFLPFKQMVVGADVSPPVFLDARQYLLFIRILII